MPFFNEAEVYAAVCFSPVMEIYDRHHPDFDDDEYWQDRRERSREYLCNLVGRPHRIYPFHFVWNDFDTSKLENFCGIKWHREENEPAYNYDDPKCTRMIDAIRDLGFAVLIEEEYDNTMRFVDDIGRGLPIIIPHLGRLNGGIERLLKEDFWSRQNTYADMSTCREEDTMEFLSKYGPHRLLYGSDFPFGNSVIARQTIENLDLPEADQKLILGENIMRLLKNVDKYD